MSLEGENFYCSGPKLTSINWKNIDDRRSVAASLVKGVYIRERDRIRNRQGSDSAAPPWWNSFGFKYHSELVDTDSSIFGIIYESKLINTESSIFEIPRYVIAFRGTMMERDCLWKDLKLDLRILLNKLHRSSRSQKAIEAVENIAGNSAVWLAGHSLGSAMAILAGKHMAKMGIFLEAYLFNPPFVSAPLEKIKREKVKQGFRICKSIITAGLATAAKVKHHNKNQSNEEPFVALKEWVPCLFVNPCDHISKEYIGYFKHRKLMEDIGLGGIERLATRHSTLGSLKSVIGKKSDEPLCLIPSANLTVNVSPSREFMIDHGISQWWRSDLSLESPCVSFTIAKLCSDLFRCCENPIFVKFSLRLVFALHGC